MAGMNSKIVLVAAGLLGSLFICPASVPAHLVNTGMGPVYDGIGHLFLTPEDIVPTLALALYSGLRGPRAGRSAMFLLPLAWLAGGLIGLRFDAVPPFPVSSLSFILLGLLIATDVKLPDRIVGVLTVIVGVMHGVLNGIVLQAGPGIPALFGIAGALFVFVALIGSFVVSLERSWHKIVVRVVGSWIAASGLLMIGWFIKGPIS